MTKIIQHIKPNLKMPEMMCDIPLSKHLETDPILKYLNKTFTCGVIGKKGSGKSSIIISWLQTKNKLKKVFYQVFVFMPSTSRASIKNSVYSKLPEDQIFENVNFENLQYVYDILKENSKNKKFTLLIFDDVQSFLKNTEIEKNLLHIIQNSRHLRCCVFILAQNWNKIPSNIRIAFNDLILFNISKKEYNKIYEEWLEIDEIEWEEVLKYYRKQKEINNHSFIYIHEQYKIFVNYDEIEFE
jgi:hypothetical protein